MMRGMIVEAKFRVFEHREQKYELSKEQSIITPLEPSPSRSELNWKYS